MYQCVCTCAQSESCSWADNTQSPHYKGQRRWNRKGPHRRSTIGQMSLWLPGDAVRETKVAAVSALMHQTNVIAAYRTHLVDSVRCFPELHRCSQICWRLWWRRGKSLKVHSRLSAAERSHFKNGFNGNMCYLFSGRIRNSQIST